ncbi:MAG TPA: helix-turn-helix domain-containing protein [Candidatus Thermoplasmatota archaeon]|nr:helix-turn-helix domain-containing protein [Candidatus Thermoplasmatota archaeon]
MVSRRKPGDALDLDAVERRLRDLARESRRSLFEPWRAMLADSDALQEEMDRVVAGLQVFFNKWVVEIVIVLGQRGTVRFNELKASLSGISGRTLSQRLRDLESQGLVRREVHDEMPVRVEYSLTKRGLDVAALALPLVLYLTMAREP